MKRFVNRHIVLFVLLAFSFGYAQEGYISTSRNMQFINPSYHGINMISKAGVNYSRFDFGEGTSYIDNKYLYGNFAFEEMNFSCLLYTSPSPRDRTRSRMPSSA